MMTQLEWAQARKDRRIVKIYFENFREEDEDGNGVGGSSYAEIIGHLELEPDDEMIEALKQWAKRLGFTDWTSSDEDETSGNYMVYRDGAGVAGFAREDDRNLFQSAPELLEALETIVRTLSGCGIGLCNDNCNDNCYERAVLNEDEGKIAGGYAQVVAEQAVAKAKGVNDATNI